MTRRPIAAALASARTSLPLPHGLLLAALLTLTACSSTAPDRSAAPAPSPPPEPVVIAPSPAPEAPARAASAPSAPSAPAAAPASLEPRLAGEPRRVRLPAGTVDTRTPATPLPCPVVQTPLSTRPVAQLRQLFQRQAVTGTDLFVELSTLSRVLEDAGTVSAARLVRQLTGCETGAVTAGSRAAALRLFGLAGTEGLDRLEPTLSAAALREHLERLLQDSRLLAQETLALPAPDGLTPVDQQRILNLAAVVMGARLSARQVPRTQATTSELLNGYARLAGGRQETARALFEGLAGGDDRSSPLMVTLARTLEPRERAALRQQATSRSAEDFSRDFAAQGLALAWLREVNPPAFQADRSLAESLQVRSRNQARAQAGLGAYASLMGAYGPALAQVLAARPEAQVTRLRALGNAFQREATPLLRLAAAMPREGAPFPRPAADALGPAPLFIVRHVEGNLVEAPDARALRGWLREAGLEAALEAALLGDADRDIPPPLLLRSLRCDPAETGRLLDRALDPPSRETFRAALPGAPVDKPFSFSRALGERSHPARARTVAVLRAWLRAEALQPDTRAGAPTRASLAVLEQARGAITAAVAEGSDEAWLRLIAISHADPTRATALPLDAWTLMPVVSARALYLQAEQAAQCQRGEGSETAINAAPPPAAAASAPGAVKRPARPPAAAQGR